MNRSTSTSEIPRYYTKSNDRWWELFTFLSLFILAIILYTFHLGNVPLRDWDEGTFAQVAKEISESSFSQWRWLFPTIWGEPYLNKPPLIHSLTALVYTFFGVSEFSTRIVGASLTALSVPLLYSLARELFLPRYYAFFSALVYLTTMPVVRHGRLAMLDGAVLCFQILMMLFVLKARRDLRWGLPAGIAFGLICLSKGWMLGFLLGSIVLLFLMWDTPRLIFSVYLWFGFFLGILPVIGWQIAQYLHYGEQFINTSVKDQSLDRVFTAVEGHRGAIWYYAIELLKYPHPWIFIAIVGIVIAWKNRNWSWAKFILVWSFSYLIAVSVMGTKLPWYIMPIYPALSIASGVALAEIKSLPSFISYPRSFIALFGFLSFAVTAGFCYFLLTQPDNQHFLTLLALLAVTFFVTTILLLKKDIQFIGVLFWGMYVSLMVFFSSNYWLWELNEAYAVKPIAEIIKQEIPPQEKVYIFFDYDRPSMNFYSERRVIPVNLEKIEELGDIPSYLLVNEENLAQLDLISDKNYYCQKKENLDALIDVSSIGNCWDYTKIPTSQYMLLKPIK